MQALAIFVAECLHLAGIPDFIVANNLKDGEKIKNDAVCTIKKSNNNNESLAMS